jgi:hypothetical protein
MNYVQQKTSCYGPERRDEARFRRICLLGMKALREKWRCFVRATVMLIFWSVRFPS